MKTIRQWLNTLPKDVREKAIEEIKKEWTSSFDYRLKMKAVSLDMALRGSFVFNDFNFDYWKDVIKKYSQCTE